MAKLKLNSALKGIKGGIDDWVYRTVRGRIVISRRRGPSIGPISAAQEAVRERFRLAADYGRAGIQDPAMKVIYEPVAKERGISLYSAMMTDYLTPPTVNVVDLTGYHGLVGDVVKVRASDDVGVTKVSVAINGADGTLLETGDAVLVFGSWIYAATTQRVSGIPVTITATAGDRPGNVGRKSETWM